MSGQDLSLRKNILANYASQFYVTAIGILILPLYIKYMGGEAYGLVGFFTMLQAWFGLLDIGLTPTIGRETARFKGGSMTALAYRQLFRALSLIFTAIALVGGGVLFLLADIVAERWLKIASLDVRSVVTAVQIMAISVALRWMCGLFRGVVTGFERLVWLSGFNSLIATLRFIAVFASMWCFGFNPLVFFIHQLVVAILELLGLLLMAGRLLPNKKKLEAQIGWSIKPVNLVLKFALTIAFTSSIWVLVTQTDKLILSGILPLAEYGSFTLAVLAASGIMIISAPVSSAIMPRMARLNAEGKNDEMIQLYRNATQMVSIVAGSTSVTVALFSEQLLYAWTGDRDLSCNAAPVLALYAIGNGILSVSAFPYYLQYALGNLRYHLIGNLIIAFTLIPLIVVLANFYGGVGAGWAWVFVHSLFLLVWVAFVHSKLKSGLHSPWILKDVILIYASEVLFALFVKFVFSVSFDSRLATFFVLLAIGLACLIVASISSSVARVKIKRFSRWVT